MTFRRPFIPPAAWPGTVQRYSYVPAVLKITRSVALPPGEMTGVWTPAHELPSPRVCFEQTRKACWSFPRSVSLNATARSERGDECPPAAVAEDTANATRVTDREEALEQLLDDVDRDEARRGKRPEPDERATRTVVLLRQRKLGRHGPETSSLRGPSRAPAMARASSDRSAPVRRARSPHSSRRPACSEAGERRTQPPGAVRARDRGRCCEDASASRRAFYPGACLTERSPAPPRLPPRAPPGAREWSEQPCTAARPARRSRGRRSRR